MAQTLVTPRCEVCPHYGKDSDAKFLAFVRQRSGRAEWRQWTVVCKEHRRDFVAFRLVKVSGT